MKTETRLNAEIYSGVYNACPAALINRILTSELVTDQVPGKVGGKLRADIGVLQSFIRVDMTYHLITDCKSTSLD